jgi:hypothetical protein
MPNIFDAAVRYRRATAGSSHENAHPDNSTQQTGQIYSAPLHICRAVLLLLQQRRGTAGKILCTAIKYLRGAVGIGLGTTIKHLRRTTRANAGNGRVKTLNYLRGAAGSGRAQRSRTCDAQQAPPRATAWARR